jgi:hypothetical protein
LGDVATELAIGSCVQKHSKSKKKNMTNKLLFWIGILGVAFFAISSILGGLLLEPYDSISQFISESVAVGTPYGEQLRFFGYIPSGILLTIFSFGAIKKFPSAHLITIGFCGLALFYGIASIVVGLFPCDIGCNKDLIDLSLSQLIHNLTGFLTYIFVPISMLLISIGLRKSKQYLQLSTFGIVCSVLCLVFVGLVSDPLSNLAGLYQRIIESLFIFWFIACAIAIKNGVRG